MTPRGLLSGYKSQGSSSTLKMTETYVPLLCLKLLVPSQRVFLSFCVYFTAHFLEMGFLKLWHRIFNVVTLATLMIAFHIGGCIQEVIVRHEANAIIGDQLFILTQKMVRCIQRTMNYKCVSTVTVYAYDISLIVLPNIIFFIHTCYVLTPVALQTGTSRVRFPMVSLEFSIDIIVSVALWPWGRLSL
jgi:hypothetical protein